jgi:hypothetical protein
MRMKAVRALVVQEILKEREACAAMVQSSAPGCAQDIRARRPPAIDIKYTPEGKARPVVTAGPEPRPERGRLTPADVRNAVAAAAAAAIAKNRAGWGLGPRAGELN